MASSWWIVPTLSITKVVVPAFTVSLSTLTKYFLPFSPSWTFTTFAGRLGRGLDRRRLSGIPVVTARRHPERQERGAKRPRKSISRIA